MKSFIREALRNRLLFENYSNNKFMFSKSPNGELITLYSNDQMVGDIELGYSNDSMEVLQLDVLDKHRGKGYAKLLMNKAINHANKKGLSNITLEPEPMDSNGIDKSGLYDFYSKFGFVDTNDGRMVLNLKADESLNEVAKMSNDLTPTTGLYNTNDYLVLYDYSDDKIYGVIGINESSANASPVDKPTSVEEIDFYYVGAVAAEKGYGPLMYEMAMSKVHPLGIATDRDSGTSDKAFSVIKQMYNRGLGKYQISSDDESFINSGDEEYSKIINTIYYYDNSSDYNKLISAGNKLLSEKQNPSSFLNSLNERASHFFFARLDESEDKTITCKNCGWHWKESESEKDDLYICHKCWHDNTPRNINQAIVKSELVNIDDDDLYDSLDNQANTLRSTSEISFGSADPFEVLYDDETGRLVGATWIETSGAFSPHMIIDPEYRKMGLSQQLIDGFVEKYKKMKQLRGDDYVFMLNVVNSSLANTMEKHYGFKKVSEDPHGNITMTL